MRRTTSSKQMFILTLASLAVIGASTAGEAQIFGSSGRKAVRQACASDIHSLCADVERGGGRKIACLKQNADKLSPSCKQALDASGR